MILRRLFGFSGPMLTGGVLGEGCERECETKAKPSRGDQ
jgi:hypothetical protein